MALLTDDWGYAVASGEMDPNDPVVNTASEYMFQMATVAYHTLNGVQTVVLTEDVEYNGELFPAGEYDFAIAGRTGMTSTASIRSRASRVSRPGPAPRTPSSLSSASAPSPPRR